MTDNIDNLMRDLALKDSGLHRVEHPTTGAMAIFPDVKVWPQGSPEARAAEDAWEARALAMHAAQRTIIPEAKPTDSPFAGKKITRGD